MYIPLGEAGAGVMEIEGEADLFRGEEEVEEREEGEAGAGDGERVEEGADEDSGRVLGSGRGGGEERREDQGENIRKREEGRKKEGERRIQTNVDMKDCLFS